MKKTVKPQTTLPLATISRRRTLASLLGVGGAAIFIPAWNETVEAGDTITCVSTTPTVTEGPYWVDEKLFRSDIRTDPSTGVARAGVPLTLTINVQNLTGGACSLLSGAYVDIWHCDAKGIYSDESTYNPGGGTGTVTTLGQKFLRGYQITDGNGQVTFTTIYPGWYAGRTIHIHFRVRTYNGTQVLSNFVSQIFFDEATNNAALAASDYTRSQSRTTVNSNDMVYNVANNTRMLATTTGSVAAGYTATITVGASFQAPAAQVPAISAGGVGNAVSGGAGIVAGSWIAIYGGNLSTAERILVASDLTNNALPTTLAGVTVKINNKAAFPQYVSPAQINVLAPDDSSIGTVSVSLSNAAGTSNTVTANLLPVLPGLSTLAGYVRAVRYPDSALVNGTGSAESGFTTVAAIGQGGILSLYGTGFGPTSSPIAAGINFTGAYETTSKVTVTIGELPATVLWAGLVGPGLYQINVQIPAALADGDHTVIATVGGASSPNTAKLKVAASARLSAIRQSTSTLLARNATKLPVPAGHVEWINHLLGMQLPEMKRLT